MDSPGRDARPAAHLPLNLRLRLLYHGCLILQAELRLWDGGEKVLSGTFSHNGQNGLPGGIPSGVREENMGKGARKKPRYY